MSEEQTIRRIENHMDHFLLLPPTPSFTRGLKLIPGLNTVPVLYLDELNQRVLEVPARKEGGRLLPESTRRPADKMWADLQQHVRRVSVNGSESWGPQITIYDDIMADRQDGPPPPMTLPANNKTLAQKILAVTTERAAVERWAQQGRGEVAEMAKARLQELRSVNG
jgi:hypothetical protein